VALEVEHGLAGERTERIDDESIERAGIALEAFDVVEARRVVDVGPLVPQIAVLANEWVHGYQMSGGVPRQNTQRAVSRTGPSVSSSGSGEPPSASSMT
jgi:hypothetical protein